MKTETQPQTRTDCTRNSRLTFYHPNAAGSGSAARLELRLDRDPGNGSGCFFLEIAPQKTAGTAGPERQHATFDWEQKITVKLGFTDICELVAVLDGRRERAGGERNGLFHDTPKANTIVSFKRGDQGNAQLLLGLSRKEKATGKMSKVHTVLNEVEAIGLRYVLQAGLFHLAFHPVEYSTAG